MFCTACGAQQTEGAAFCGACGRPLGSPAPGTPWPAAAQPPGFPAVIPGAFPAPVYAGFWLRFVAYLIDGVVLVIPAIVAGLVAFAIFGTSFRAFANSSDEPDPATLAVVIAVFFGFLIFLVVGQWLYFAWMESSEKQATLGKSALGLIVTDMEGHRVSFGRATGRFFAKIITGFVPLYIGFIMAGFTAKKQALHDMIASCLVVRKS